MAVAVRLLTRADVRTRALNNNQGCQQGDFSYIATGTAQKGAETYIKIWRATIRTSLEISLTRKDTDATVAGLPSPESMPMPTQDALSNAVVIHWNVRHDVNTICL